MPEQAAGHVPTHADRRPPDAFAPHGRVPDRLLSADPVTGAHAELDGPSPPRRIGADRTISPYRGGPDRQSVAATASSTVV
ncbi:hypothetical protein AMK22_23670 [Streptomyces sp. CB01580]|nr:hypothetical protein AMK22_23670 [Streptomyces sp. CB01580]